MAWDVPRRLVLEYYGHHTLYRENATFHASALRERTLNDFREHMHKFDAQIALFQAMPQHVVVGIFSADARVLRTRFLPSPRDCLGSVRRLVPKLADEASERLLEEVRSAEEQLRREPDGIGAFVAYAIFLGESPERHTQLEKRWQASEEMHELCVEFAIQPSEGSKATRKALTVQLNGLSDLISAHQTAFDERRAKWSDKIVEGVNALRTRAADERLVAEDPRLFDGATPIEAALEHIARTRPVVAELTERATQFERWQADLKLPIALCDEARSLATSMRVVHEVWACLEDSASKMGEWEELPVVLLEPSEIEAAVVRYQRAVSQAERALPPNSVLPVVRLRIETCRQLLPLVQALRNPHLKPPHFDKLDQAVGAKLPREDELTVRAALAAGLHTQSALVAKIAADATQEATLLEMLAKVKAQWAVTEFVTKPFKDLRDVCVLGAVDDVMTTLEETQLVMQSILGSPHVTALRAEAEEWGHKLALFSDVLDEWLACQRAWMYLESIFAAPGAHACA